MDFLHLTGLVSTSKVARGRDGGGGCREAQEEGDIWILMRIHAVVQQKRMQHCKTIIPQYQFFKIKKIKKSQWKNPQLKQVSKRFREHSDR